MRRGPIEALCFFLVTQRLLFRAALGFLGDSVKIIYHLGARQKKEMLVRSVAIRVAFPAPPIEIDDALDWCRSVLPADLRPYVRSAEEVELRVVPHTPGQVPGAGGWNLTDLIGAIRPDDAPPTWTVPVAAIVAVMATATASRTATHDHGVTAVKWPADVLVDGVSLCKSRTEK